MGYVYLRQEFVSQKTKKNKKKKQKKKKKKTLIITSVELYFEIFIDNHRSSHCAHSQ